MAIRYNNAGQYCKRSASKMAGKIILSLCACVFICAVIVTLAVTERTPALALVVVVPGFFAVLYGLRRLDKWTEQLAHERIRFLRGGQAEGFVAWLLEDLPKDWHLLNNVQLVEGSDVDHVLIGPNGVFCLSTKSYRGLFTREADGRVFYNNAPTGLLGDTMKRAMELRKRLEALLGHDVPFVEPVLAVPFCYVDFSGRQNGVWILHQEDLVKTIEGFKKRYSPQQVRRYAGAVHDISKNARTMYIVPKESAAATK